MEAFTRLLGGNIVAKLAGYQDLTIISNSTITATSLMHTKEFTSLNDKLRQQTGPLQSFVQGSATDMHLRNSSAGFSELRLADAIEDMFRNFTISLTSVESLQSEASVSAPELTNVTINTYKTVYAYSETRLWLAYGLAIGATAGAVILGIWAMFRNQGSYSGNLSTVLRTSRVMALSEDIRPEDMDGRDPLPKHLASAIVTVGNEKTTTAYSQHSDRLESPEMIPLTSISR